MALSSRRLVPGDVVVLQRGKATCDMVLLRGAGLVEESMMSGEVHASLDASSSLSPDEVKLQSSAAM